MHRWDPGGFHLVGEQGWPPAVIQDGRDVDLPLQSRAGDFRLVGLACLRDYAGSRPSYIVPGADLYDDVGTRVRELDLLGYIGEQVVAGEVKTSPADFTEKQITKDLSLAARIGADIYVMVAVYALTSAQEGMAATLAVAQGSPSPEILRARPCCRNPQCRRDPVLLVQVHQLPAAVRTAADRDQRRGAGANSALRPYCPRSRRARTIFQPRINAVDHAEVAKIPETGACVGLISVSAFRGGLAAQNNPCRLLSHFQRISLPVDFCRVGTGFMVLIG